MQETWVRILDWEDPLEKSMATHSSIVAWRIPWTEEPDDRLLSIGLQRIRQDWSDWARTHVYYSQFLWFRGPGVTLLIHGSESLKGKLDCVLIWRLDLGRICSWAPSDCWQNPFLRSCKTDGFSLLLKPVSASRDCSWFLDLQASPSGHLFHDSL